MLDSLAIKDNSLKNGPVFRRDPIQIARTFVIAFEWFKVVKSVFLKRD